MTSLNDQNDHATSLASVQTSIGKERTPSFEIEGSSFARLSADFETAARELEALGPDFDATLPDPADDEDEHDGTSYGLAALRGECERIRSVWRVTGDTLNASSYRVGQLIDACNLDQNVVRTALLDALVGRRSYEAVPDAERIVDNAIDDGRLTPRIPPHIPEADDLRDLALAIALQPWPERCGAANATVLLDLIEHARAHGRWEVIYSGRFGGNRLRRSEPAVRDALRRLENEGWLERKRDHVREHADRYNLSTARTRDLLRRFRWRPWPSWWQPVRLPIIATGFNDREVQGLRLCMLLENDVTPALFARLAGIKERRATDVLERVEWLAEDLTDDDPELAAMALDWLTVPDVSAERRAKRHAAERAQWRAKSAALREAEEAGEALFHEGLFIDGSKHRVDLDLGPSPVELEPDRAPEVVDGSQLLPDLDAFLAKERSSG